MARRAERDGLLAGAIAPAIDLEADDGTHFALADVNAEFMLLVFYPGDETPVCTAQLCDLRNSWSALQAAGVAVYGVNPAGRARHRSFRQRHSLPFPLLVDADRRASATYGCVGWFGFIRRTVVLIGPDRRITRIWRGRPTPEAVLEAVEGAR